ncbi:MAG: DUF2281 domain-containing protein [Symploca sp. SIO2E6]|nr:DUF2281 domain-containing protein [Symploca sp. SIO2E6]
MHTLVGFHFFPPNLQQSTPEPSQHSTESLFGCLKGRVTILGDIVEPIEDAGWELLA